MSKIATMIKNENGRYQAIFEGAVLASSSDPEYVVMMVKNGLSKKARALGVTEIHKSYEMENVVGSTLTIETAAPLPKFTVDERFEFLTTLANMVINETAPSLLVTGPGGYGKTYTVLQAILAAGLTIANDVEDPGEKAEGEEDKKVDNADVHFVKGFSTARGMYRTLYENNGKLIVFDDCDSILRDSNAVNILKSALDSYEARWISWNAEARIGDPNPLPKVFLFTGRVIFISNMGQEKIPQPIRSRCLRVDLSMTTKEKIERMYTIVNSGSFMPDVEMSYKLQAVKFLEDNQNFATELSMRTLISVVTIALSEADNWQRLALYNISA